MRQTLLFLAFTAVTTLVLLELGLRVLGYHPLTIDSSVWRDDPKLGWAQTPGAKEVFHRLGFSQEIEINSLGLREREIPYDKPKGIWRIMVIGDSKVAAFEVPLEDRYTIVAENELKRQGYDVEIISAGCRGWGTDQVLIFLQDDGVKYQPDVVLYMWSGNDVDNIMTVHKPFREFGKSYFQLDDDGRLELKGVPVPRFPYTQSLRLNEKGEVVELDVAFSHAARLFVRDYTAGSSAVAAALLHALQSAPQLMATIRALGRTPGYAPPNSVDEKDQALGNQFSYRLARSLVQEMKTTADGIGAELRMLEAGSPFAAKIVTEVGLEEFKAYERYRELVPAGAVVRPPFDPHWNSLGSAYYGKALAAELIAQGLAGVAVDSERLSSTN